MNEKKIYGIAIKDAFGKWNAPLFYTTRERARAYAHFTLAKGTHPVFGEVAAVSVKAKATN